MRTLLHETDDVVFSLIEKQKKYYAEITCKSENFSKIVNEINSSLFKSVFDYFEEHNNYEIGVIITSAFSPQCLSAILSSVVALIAENDFAESEDMEIYDGLNFPFKWVAIKEKETFFVAYSVTKNMLVGNVLKGIFC